MEFDRVSNFRNPPLAWRVAIVAIAYSLPGTLAGALASLLLGKLPACVIAGAFLGAMTGALLESGGDIIPPDD